MGIGTGISWDFYLGIEILRLGTKISGTAKFQALGPLGTLVSWDCGGQWDKLGFFGTKSLGLLGLG